MTAQDLTTEQLTESIIRAQQYLLNVPQVQQELQVLLQEKQARDDKKKMETIKEEKKK